MPEQDAVVVITSESFDLPATLNLVWAHLLPLFTKGALANNYLAQDNLKKREKELNIPAPSLSNSSLSSVITGKEYILTGNSFGANSVSFKFAGDACLFNLKDQQGNHEVFCGMDRWLTVDQFKTQIIFPMPGRPEVPTPLAAAAHWSDENTLEISLRYLETAHSDHIAFTFHDQEVTMKFSNSVARGNPAAPDPRASLTGKFT